MKQVLFSAIAVYIILLLTLGNSICFLLRSTIYFNIISGHWLTTLFDKNILKDLVKPFT